MVAYRSNCLIMLLDSNVIESASKVSGIDEMVIRVSLVKLSGSLSSAYDFKCRFILQGFSWNGSMEVLATWTDRSMCSLSAYLIPHET